MINPLSPDRPFIPFAESASDETSKPMKRDERQPSYSNRRRQYLKRLRLNHDPFTHTTTELEFQSNEQLEKLEESDDDDDGRLQPSFLTYFVHPPYDSKTELVEDRDELLLSRLKWPEHSFVYAGDGCGKTMLRYMLEAECRSVSEQTLVISYTLGKESTTILTRPIIEALLNETLATDLFVQIIEQFGRQQERLDEAMLARLIPYWREGIPHFERKLRRHLALGQPYSGTEISAWWTVWRRIAVRYRPFTPSIVKFVRSILAWPKKQPKSAGTLKQGLILAQQLGYKQAFILLDTVDKDNHDETPLPVTEIIAAINTLDSPIPLYIKAFLPDRLASTIQRDARLTSQPFSAIIRWDKPDTLLQIIENRFRSAGSWINGLDAISSQTIATKVNARLIQYAQGSPRRLLQVVSNLIDAHVQNKEAAETYLLTESDWQAMYQSQIYKASSSKSLPESTMSRGVVENGQRNNNSFGVSEGVIC